MTGFANLQSIEVVRSYFRGCTSIVNVNWNNAKLTDNSGAGIFSNCTNLQRVTNISNTVVNMRSAFSDCTSLTDSPTIPNSVRDVREVFSGCINLRNCSALPERTLMLDSAFKNCYSLTNFPAIPSSTQTMAYTFYFCNNLRNAPDLSKCVALTNMFRCFAYNYNLTQTPVIPNKVTDICNTFQGCTNITSFPIIPNSVTNLSYTFDQCRNVAKCNVNIPTQITDMSHTFYRCAALTGKIFITSENITNAASCFGETTGNKKVYIPFKNSLDDTVNSETYNAFIAAGYDANGTTDGVTLFDLAEYEPPVKYDFADQDGELNSFVWTNDLSIQQSASTVVTNVNTTGIISGQNMSVSGTTISHTSNNEQSPGEQSYVGFLFNISSGMFKPTALNFDICKNGTDGGSVLVTLQFDNMDEEEIICSLSTIARNNAVPPYTRTSIDLSSFDFGASKGNVSIKFYLYKQGSSKTFTLSNITLSGLLLVNDVVRTTLHQFDRVNDKATVVDFWTDGAGQRYAICVPDAQYRTYDSSQARLFYWSREQGTDTPLTNYATADDALYATESGTYNTQLFLATSSNPAYNTAFVVATSGPCAASIEIDGVTFSSCLANLPELNLIKDNRDILDSLDPTAEGVGNRLINISQAWSSNEASADNGWTIVFTGIPLDRNKTNGNVRGVISVIEVPVDNNNIVITPIPNE